MRDSNFDFEKGLEYQWIVFEGPVAWNENLTETGLNPTNRNWTPDCGCSFSRLHQLPVALFLENTKTVQKPVAIGCNRFLYSNLLYSNVITIYTNIITIYANII